MNKNYILIIYFCLALSQEYIGEGLNSQNLIEFLQQNYSTNNVLSYGNARDVLYSQIDDDDGIVRGIYTNYEVLLDPSQDPSTHLYNNGMDCEHLWPQSMYEGTSPMKSDMHHLRPCKSNVNGSRGNKPFDNIPDIQTNTWFWLGYQYNNIPSSNINEYSESASSSFEPREDVKGDIARSMFYFYTIYSEYADQEFFEEQKNILKQWHYLDLPTNDEISRTWDIAQYQDNLPNPFVVDTTLIRRCFYYIEQQIGDINNDNITNINDIVILVNFILGYLSFNNDEFVAADLDSNNVINVVDIVLLVEMILL